MATIYENIFTNEALDYLINHPDVLNAKVSLDSQVSENIYFSIPGITHIWNTLNTRFGLKFQLDNNTRIPMRWIKGDTPPHIDFGASQPSKIRI